MSSDSSILENNTNIQLIKSNVYISQSSINELQMISSDESTHKNDSCLVFARSESNMARNSMIKTIPTDNCSQPRYALCQTKPIILHLSKNKCLEKPLTLDLPVMISNHMTSELCRSLCGNLTTIFAVVQMNKCYCGNLTLVKSIENIFNDSIHRKRDCGKPCPGMFYHHYIFKYSFWIARHVL